MQLVKITPDAVQIKSDDAQLGDMSINSTILLSDKNKNISIVCTVTSITKNEETEQFNFDGEPLDPEVTSTINCSIIGSLKNDIFTKSVDYYPSTAVQIKTVDEDLFRRMLNSDKASGFNLGKYANYNCLANLDGNKFFQRHSAILGNTGSGKSVTVASVLEKIVALPSANVILFDLHGEYSGLSYAKTIKIGEDGLDFLMWFLSLKDIYGNLLRIKEETAQVQISALRKAFYESRNSDKSEDIPIVFNLDGLIARLDEMNNEEISTGECYKTGDKAGLQKTVKGDNNGKLTSVINLLADKQVDKRYRFMVEPHHQVYLNYFISNIFDISDKNIKVIDLSNVPSEMAPTIIAVIAKLIYKVQLQQDRESLIPLNIICDEAHVYIPTSDFGLGASQRRLLEVFETIAKEGRKFGTSLMIVSQRPSELNRTIMAQCANYIILKMSNDADKQMIKSILPDGSKSVIDSVNLFSPGDCLVIGDSSEIICKIKVDLPNELPKSNTINTWDVWNNETKIDVNSLVEKLIEG